MPLQERRAALEAQSCLAQFFRDVEEEMDWVREKLPLAMAQDCGESLQAVQQLQEQQQVRGACSEVLRLLSLGVALDSPLRADSLASKSWGCLEVRVGSCSNYQLLSPSSSITELGE